MEKINSGRTRAMKTLRGILPFAVPILIFAVTAVILTVSIRNAGRARADEEIRIAREGIIRAAVSCYAVEGAYPESYEYLRDNYGVVINEDKYFVDYAVFASNLMPEITVIAR